MIATARRQRDNLTTIRLCSAAAHGDLAKVQQLLSTGQIDVSRGDYDKRTPLHIAASRGHIKVVELLLVSQADVNAVDRGGRTPLREAQQSLNNELVQLLISKGAEPSVEGMAERMCAAAADPAALDELSFLIKGGANPSTATAHDSRTALHVAASAGNVEHVKLLIKAKASLNVTDCYNSTPLHDAFTHRHTECSALLLAAGANMGSFDSAGALCDAAGNDDVDLLRRILDHGCDINSENYDGRTALHIAAGNLSLAACTFLVSREDLKRNQEDRYGDTPYDDALRGKGELRTVVTSLLKAFGGKPGSKAIRPSSSRALAEQQRAISDMEQIELVRTLIIKAKRCQLWAKDELKLAKGLLKAAEDACDLEDAEGAVLDLSKPDFLAGIVTFASSHRERYSFASTFLLPLLRAWQKQQDQYGSLKAELHKKVCACLQSQ